MNLKENLNLMWKTKSVSINTEEALWGEKYREFNQAHVFLSKN